MHERALWSTTSKTLPAWGTGLTPSKIWSGTTERTPPSSSFSLLTRGPFAKSARGVVAGASSHRGHLRRPQCLSRVKQLPALVSTRPPLFFQVLVR